MPPRDQSGITFRTETDASELVEIHCIVRVACDPFEDADVLQHVSELVVITDSRGEVHCRPVVPPRPAT